MKYAPILLLITPTSALAEVCDKMRPLWQSEWGAVDWVREFFSVVLHPINIVFLLIVAILIYVRNRVTLIIAGLMLIFLGGIQIVGRRDPIFDQAMIEGCIGNPILVIISGFSLGLGCLWRGLGLQTK